MSRETLFKSADEVLTDRLDLDIELFKLTNPVFYHEYKMARIVSSSGFRSLSIKGSVKDIASKSPIKGVQFTFTAEQPEQSMRAAVSEKPKPIVKKSAAKGNFRMWNLPEGLYRVLIKKTGYREQMVNITVSKDEMFDLAVELERL